MSPAPFRAQWPPPYSGQSGCQLIRVAGEPGGRRLGNHTASKLAAYTGCANAGIASVQCSSRKLQRGRLPPRPRSPRNGLHRPLTGKSRFGTSFAFEAIIGRTTEPTNRPACRRLQADGKSIWRLAGLAKARVRPESIGCRRKGSNAMSDLAYVLATIGFFAISVIYTYAIGRI